MKPLSHTITSGDLDLELNLLEAVPHAEQQIHALQAASRDLIQRFGSQTVPYGQKPSHRYLEITPPDFTPGNGIAVFVHGGYWRAFSAQDFLIAGQGFLQQRKKLISIDYPLCPQASMSDIADSVQQAFLAIEQRHPTERIWAVGHSAGAHLVAMLCCSARLRASSHQVERAYLLSGLYDLRPIAGSFLQPVLQISQNESSELSPILHPPAPAIEYRVIYGSAETGIFKRQGDIYLQHLLSHGCKAWQCEVDANHFNIQGSNWLEQADCLN